MFRRKRQLMDRIEKRYDLTKGKPWKILLYFALPIFLGTLFQSVYTVTDAVVIGRFAGKEALAAIESVYTLTKLPINFFTGLASGATLILSHYYGAGRESEVSGVSHTAIVFAFFGGLLLSLIACLASPYFIRMIQVPARIARAAQWYILIYFSGMAVSMVYNIGSGILRAVGDSKTPFWILVVSNIVNILLDLVFVGGLNLGVTGAAIATVCSQLLSALMVFGVLTRVSYPCKIYTSKLRIHREHLERIFRIGLPIGIQSTLYPIANTIVQTSINTFGVDSIAAWAISGKLDFLVWSVSDALCIAVSTFVAQNVGANRIQRAKSGVVAGIAMDTIAIGFIGGILYLFSDLFAGLLVRDAKVIALTSQIIRFLAPLYIVYILCDILPGAIRGTGNTIVPMIITLIGTCLTRVLWILYIVPKHRSLMTVLSCYPVSWGLTSVVFLILAVRIFSKLDREKSSENRI